jgi:hypothetical protein
LTIKKATQPVAFFLHINHRNNSTMPRIAIGCIIRGIAQAAQQGYAHLPHAERAAILVHDLHYPSFDTKSTAQHSR